MQNNENYVNKDELVGAAVALDAANFIIEEMQYEYFDRYDSSTEGGRFNIAVEYTRFRAKAAILSMLIHEISNAFEQNNITVYK